MSKFLDKRTVGLVAAIHPLHGTPLRVNPQRDAQIGTDLDRELTRLPTLMSWYMALRDTAEAAFKDARHHEHNTFEDLYIEASTAPLEKGARKLTEAAIKAHVNADARMRDAYRARMDADKMLRNMRSAVEVLQEKRWILMSLTKWRINETGVRDSD